ncbi:unnamed protein product [Acanthoscelides obtectus]|uniref:WD repeat-containing protein 7 n=1 Tax=Acanthoscelides obtectus TaxID=200917 RepID=A0A9P0L154_ACAOB|nr:unnamed protein product [Acanthoscelides obtectus]CAK1666310.1 WD repeat-containing protein 7 [Acanthoscelides obtectus]
MPGTSLVVPVVLWGKFAPTHCISCVYLSKDLKTLATGCYDGQICLWQVDPDTLHMIPRCLLVGHTAPVLCISRASIIQDNNYIVSSSEAGEMCTWDLVDGKCREAVKLPQVHTNMQAYHMCNCEDVRLFCNGYYPEILVMDPFSLEILFMLSSKQNPDWISALHVLRPAKRKDDVVLALTTTGMVKVWTLLGHENKHLEPIYENESKQIRTLNAVCLQCCSYNQRTVLVVCTKYWQIYDAGDFSVLCSYLAPRGERWMSGDFLAIDRIIMWSDAGKGYLYKLPANKLRGKNISNSSTPDNKDFHTQSIESDSPFLYCLLNQPDSKPLSCPPAMSFITTNRANAKNKSRYLIRGDSEGIVLAWSIPEISPAQLDEIQKQKPPQPVVMTATLMTSLTEAWASMKPNPVGILDQIEKQEGQQIKLTASIYLPLQSKFVVGREDGTIIIVPATQTIMLQLLHGNHQQYNGWPKHQILSGHNGRVNSLLYPHREHARYDKNHLVSGGVDFAVCLWDLYAGTLLHRFCVHAGEITQLLVPPNNCSARVQKCVCSVASDHSVTLLSLAERKCVCLASRHLFPVTTIKWRPNDDFMIIGCSDGTVYVWQMETGHLDRVLQGIAAEEVLYACEEHEAADGTSEVGLANPAVHFFRGLRHRNLSAIRHATQRGLHQLHMLGAHTNNDDPHMQRNHNSPLAIQGLRTNPKDPESHILFFDVEALIIELLSEEYDMMSPGSLEAAGLISQSEYSRVANLTQSASPDAHKKIVDFFGKMKNKAENMEMIIKEKDKHDVNDNNSKSGKPNSLGPLETSHGMEIAQLLLSLLHSWGLDNDLDRVCQVKLGLLRPMVPISYGVLSKANHMSLFLPTWHNTIPVDDEPLPTDLSLTKGLPAELIRQEQITRIFTSRTHWELSTTLSTNHLLAIIALSHTLMSMSNATFVPEQERNRKLHRRSTTVNWTKTDEEHEEMYTQQQAQIKQGWSLLATLHCVLLPDKVVERGSKNFKRPQVEMMAKRWQHHCVEVREAAQTLLLAELSRMGPKGRKQLVEAWSQYLPLYTQTEPLNHQAATVSPTEKTNGNGTQSPHSPDPTDEEFEEEEEEQIRKPSSLSELKRKQSTAVILLGVIGAEFGQDITGGDNLKRRASEDRRKSSVVEGFGAGNNNLARLTAMALSHLLLAPPSPKLPAHIPLRRAAIDLIGRGFTIWAPFLDISKVLLGLLELCADADRLVPSMTYGLPLTPQADSCRTARHALTLIATARPAAFITTMAKEVARYNAMQQNAQTLNINMSNNVLHKAKPEILRVVELLIEKMQNEMADLLVELMDIILHCLDPSQLKNKSLSEVFPAVCRFNQVSHCPATRRIAVGSHTGNLTIYELRQGKQTTMHAHSQAVTALAFSPDGKFLVSYSCGENKLSFWQTSTGMFGLGQSQTKNIKSYSTAPIADVARLNPMRLARLVWMNNRTVSLMLADGSETRFNV